MEPTTEALHLWPRAKKKFLKRLNLCLKAAVGRYITAVRILATDKMPRVVIS